MKSVKLTLLAAAMTLGMANCSKDALPPSKVEIPANFADKTTAFSFDFMNKLEVAEAAANYFVSPLSLHIALGMLANGADGTTKTELESALRTTGLSTAEANQIYNQLITKLPKADPSVKLAIANSVWQSKSFTAEPSYMATLKNSFIASHFIEDFANKATVGKINQWASDNTNGKVPKVIEEIKPEHVLFLMNAVYFKGNWTHAFDPKLTNNQDFTGKAGKQTASMMFQTRELPYAAMPTYQAVELPYSKEQFAMTVILPNAGTDVSQVIKNMNTEEWNKLNTKLAKDKVLVGLPKFTMKYSRQLNEVLKQMGIKQAFTSQADLSKIAKPAGKLFVDFVKQDSYVGIDEAGTEAAAVTSIGVGLTSAGPTMPEVICNRPFFFVIREKSSNTILFIGKVISVPKG